MHVEARDASGTIQQVPVGVMTVPSCALWGPVGIGVVALVVAVLAIRAGGWAGWVFGILAAIVAIAGIGYLAFALWGRYTGIPWAFS